MSMLLDTRFSDMPAGVANRWLAWARSHDWGRGAYLDEGKVYGIVETATTDEQAFSTPRELRDWAGY